MTAQHNDDERLPKLIELPVKPVDWHITKDAFNPNEHLTDISGRDYLDVKWRLLWFRLDFPDGEITTEVLRDDGDEFVVQARVIKRHEIDNQTGNVLARGVASGIGSCSKKEWKHGHRQKAETIAIGRALNHLGYGIQFAESDGDLLDSTPVNRRSNPRNERPGGPPPRQGGGRGSDAQEDSKTSAWKKRITSAYAITVVEAQQKALTALATAANGERWKWVVLIAETRSIEWLDFYATAAYEANVMDPDLQEIFTKRATALKAQKP